MSGYRHNYSIFYQLPNSNLFTHLVLFSRENPLVKSTTPWSILYHIFFEIYFYSLLFPDLLFQKPKNTLLRFLFAPFISRFIEIYLSNLSQFYPVTWQFPMPLPEEGIDNPFYMSSCKYLFFVCMYHLYSGACSPTGLIPWFHNWGKYLPLLCCIIPSSLGKYRRRFKPHQWETQHSLFKEYAVILKKEKK